MRVRARRLVDVVEQDRAREQVRLGRRAIAGTVAQQAAQHDEGRVGVAAAAQPGRERNGLLRREQALGVARGAREVGARGVVHAARVQRRADVGAGVQTGARSPAYSAGVPSTPRRRMSIATPSPATKPPMCAPCATPTSLEDSRYGSTFCSTRRTPSTMRAGTSKTCIRNGGISHRSRTWLRGNSTK